MLTTRVTGNHTSVIVAVTFNWRPAARADLPAEDLSIPRARCHNKRLNISPNLTHSLLGLCRDILMQNEEHHQAKHCQNVDKRSIMGA
jgi:hypothetical protein